jgi:N-acetylglutamate synthase/N-acetylornithine aminotransferase
MNSEFCGEKYILISENCTYKDILERISEKMNVKKPTIQASSGLLNLVLRLDWIKSKIFQSKRKLSKTSAASLLSQTVFSNDKIKKELNYSFINIEEYLTTIIPFYKN